MDDCSKAAGPRLFARRFLLGLRCLVYESQWPGIDPRDVSLDQRDRRMREEREMVGVWFDRGDWAAISRHLHKLAGPTARELAAVADELADANDARA